MRCLAGVSQGLLDKLSELLMPPSGLGETIHLNPCSRAHQAAIICPVAYHYPARLCCSVVVARAARPKRRALATGLALQDAEMLS